MTIKQHKAFTTLQQRWNRHQELRANGAPIAELATSRHALDDARLTASRITTL